MSVGSRRTLSVVPGAAAGAAVGERRGGGCVKTVPQTVQTEA